MALVPVKKESNFPKYQYENEDKKGNNSFTISKKISLGHYDDAIIKTFRSLKIDLKRNTTTANWKTTDSCYRHLAYRLNLNPQDDHVVRELYTVVMYNKRFIRDRIMQYCHLVEGGPLRKINHIEIIQTPQELVFPSSLFSSTQSTEKASLIFVPEPHIVAALTGAKPNTQKTTTTQITTIKSVNWSTLPEEKYCPRCRTKGRTKVQFRIGICTWSWAVALFFSGICLPCFWFPFALPCTKDALHICRNCKLILGKVARDPCTKSTDWNWSDHEVKTPLKNPAGDKSPKLIINEDIV